MIPLNNNQYLDLGIKVLDNLVFKDITVNHL